MKRKKNKKRVLAVDPIVSDPTVLAKLDREREQVQEQVKHRTHSFKGYGLDNIDPASVMASLMTLKEAVGRRVRKKQVSEKQIKALEEELK
jgi:hypothetical protein